MTGVLDIRKPVFGNGNRHLVSRILYVALCEADGTPGEYFTVQKSYPDLVVRPEDVARLTTTATSFGVVFVFRISHHQVCKPIRIESDQILLSWRQPGDDSAMDLVIPTGAVIRVSGIFTEGVKHFVMPDFLSPSPSVTKPVDHSKEGRDANIARLISSANGGHPALRVVPKS